MTPGSYSEVVASNRQNYTNELVEFLSIPSVSTLSQHKGDVQRAAQWVADDLKRAGMENVRVIPTTGPLGHPLVYADWLHAEGQPTVMIYGHYDVQPPDPLDEWKTPPFEPTIRDGNVYARGSADDKGQLYVHLKAVELLMKQNNGALPVNVRFLIEGEEEVGGEGIEHYVREHPDELECDAVLISDSHMFAEGLPAIDVGLRGMVYTELTVRGARQDLHSGLYGGAVPNAINTLCHIVAKLKDEQGRIQVPGYYDDVRVLTEEERADFASLPFDPEVWREHEVGSPGLTGEPGFSALEQIGARPTLDANGIIGGFTGEGAKTVIPAVARCKISMRLVSDQDPTKIWESFKRYVEEICPPYASVEVNLIHTAEPVLLDTDSPYMRAAQSALSEVFGKKAVFLRGGGSIPIVSLFSKVLNAPSILMGFGLPDDNLHAPNEKMKLDNVFKGIEASMRYMEMLRR
ncbi:MAG: dipeptidase [Chloroflexota bacterium]|nr:dipeptidase [Chloroflexota bacterium]MDQ5866697.1 dipeptidase [Chloroflexota bacterium]